MLSRDQLALFDRDDFKTGEKEQFKDPRFWEDLNKDKRYRVAEAAEFLACNKSYVYRLVQLGKLQHVRIGLIRIPGWALIDLIKQRSSEY